MVEGVYLILYFNFFFVGLKCVKCKKKGENLKFRHF